MSDSELELYNLQLDQVSSALSKDPTNQDLLDLKGELENLISLTRSLAAQSSTAPEASSSRPRVKAEAAQFRVGEEVLARYSADGKYYTARVEAVEASGRFRVRYDGYGNFEVLPGSQLKTVTVAGPAATSAPSTSGSNSTAHPPPSPPASSSTPPPPPSPDTPQPPPPPPASAPDSYPPPPPPSSFPTAPPPPPLPSTSTPTTHPPAMDERAIRKHRNDKKLVRREHKSQLQTQKAADWQKFASKATQTKALRKSIFGTSDDPYAKVGVTKRNPSTSKDKLG